ncbi:hypothetical protein ACFV7Q_30245 [Streptomyces sp. NPDC059851]|uniref:hypothetical protein n=1 Tax=Streptomyces sp. NPDC059851 TaxID=3346971 RepID=UPI0036545A19
MDTFLGCLAVLALTALVLAPAFLGLRRDLAVDRQLREARRHPPADPPHGLGPRLDHVPFQHAAGDLGGRRGPGTHEGPGRRNRLPGPSRTPG